MIATMLTEIILFMYTLVRYKMNSRVRLGATILLFLAIFQLAEYNVCGGMGASAATWSRIGFIAITILPPLGIHLVRTIAGKGWKSVIWLAYASAAVWVFLFAFGERAFSGHVCAGNYVIFQLKPSLGFWYFTYYYGWLLLTILMCVSFVGSAKKPIRDALLLQTFGYLVFLLPTTVFNTVKPSTVSGIPSIMCGFAVLYALILVVGVLPTADKKVAPRRKKS